MLVWILAGTLVALQVPDILSTNAILARGGRELNPVVRAFMRLGRWWWLPKVAVCAWAAWLIAAMGVVEAVACLAVLNVIYLLVVVSNLRQLGRQRKLRQLNGLGPGGMRKLHLRIIRRQAKRSQDIKKHLDKTGRAQAESPARTCSAGSCRS